MTRDGNPVSPDYLSAMVKQYVDASNMGKKGACHLFRHSMATLMLEGEKEAHEKTHRTGGGGVIH